MPNIRLVLWGVLAALLFLNYQTWVHDYETASQAAQSAATQSSGSPANALGESVPQATTLPAPNAVAPTNGTVSGAVPDTSPTGTAPAIAQSATATPGAAAPADAAPSAPIRVTTDVLDIEINLKGGELDRADLLQYPQRKDTPNIPVRLLSYRTATDAVSAAKRAHRPSG